MSEKIFYNKGLTVVKKNGTRYLAIHHGVPIFEFCFYRLANRHGVNVDARYRKMNEKEWTCTGHSYFKDFMRFMVFLVERDIKINC